MPQKLRYKKLLYHSPRLMAIVFALVLIFIAAGVFSNPTFTLGEKIFSFATKLIKPAIIIAALIFAWKHEIVGGIIFITLGFAFFMFGWNYILLWRLLLSGLALVFIGVLFLINAKEFRKD
ncbi:MAG: hypothetical protein U9R19_06935 [Bacteroidota bacterium]|nr:hypothetical protein [Bacteroidota bacterium]